MRPRPPLTLVLALLAGVGLAACGGDEDKGRSGGSASGGSTQRAPKAGAGACKKVAKPKPKKASFRRPKKSLERGTKATAVVQTSCGTFEIALDTKRSPKTSSSFAFLVGERFYDNTAFHRIVPDFVIQGGDPKGDGTGGPGYSVEEKPPQSIAYTRGVVAMAKTEVEPPGTSGSQLYVVTAADAGLPPDYALLGKVTKGLDVIERIGKLGDPASGGAGVPTQTVVIERITLNLG